MEIPGYKIQHQVGQGGMATVYLALQESLNRSVVLKILDISGSAFDGTLIERFLSEGRIVAPLNPPNIITIYDIGIADDYLFISMEYIEGGNLQDRMIKEYQWKEIMAMGRQVASGLSYAHKKDIIHGNIRPSNILFNKKNVPIVTDFTLKSHYKNDVDKINWYAPPEPVISQQGDIFALGAITKSLPRKLQKIQNSSDICQGNLS